MAGSNPFIKTLRESAGFRLSVLFGSFFVFLILSSIIGTIITSLPGNERTHILLSSTVQCILAFCVPALLLARFSSNNWKDWLYLTRVPSIKALIGVVLVYLLSLPAMEWLIEWNNNLSFPESMASLESLLRKWENSSAETTSKILETQGFIPVLMGVLIIGVLTGFSEELFFRGGLQGILTRGSIGIGVSVWVTAIIFSAMHFQFFGFLPRLIMGVFFGYLLVWTKSIWVPVFAHILNNSIVVITAAINGNQSINMGQAAESILSTGNSVVVIASVLLTVGFFIFYKNSVFKTHNPREYKWQKKHIPPVSER